MDNQGPNNYNNNQIINYDPSIHLTSQSIVSGNVYTSRTKGENYEKTNQETCCKKQETKRSAA